MKYFTIKELTASTVALKKNIDNTPTEQVVDNLTKLIENVLDPLREWYGKPIYVNSGYRSEELNKAVGGVSTSQHRYGMAADITVNNKEGNKILFDYINNNLPFDQLIDESNFSWIHVSYKENSNRKQVLQL